MAAFGVGRPAIPSSGGSSVVYLAPESVRDVADAVLAGSANVAGLALSAAERSSAAMPTTRGRLQ
jgi:hypothetical protein